MCATPPLVRASEGVRAAAAEFEQLAVGGDGPVCALDDLAEGQGGEEAVHGLFELGGVAGHGAVDC
jgi:hypothetical protein